MQKFFFPFLVLAVYRSFTLGTYLFNFSAQTLMYNEQNFSCNNFILVANPMPGAIKNCKLHDGTATSDRDGG